MKQAAEIIPGLVGGRAWDVPRRSMETSTLPSECPQAHILS